MKPLRGDKQLGWVSPLNCAAIQKARSKAPLGRKRGLDVSHHLLSREERGENFFLTSPFIG
jgi:hypothetical protein